MKLKTTKILFTFFLFALSLNNSFAQLKYPVTKKVNQVDDYFGTKVSDPYRWLEYDTAADTKQWIQTEQSFTENYLSKIPFRALIKKQVEKVINYPRFFSGFKAGDYIFYTKNDGLQNQSVYYYQKGLNGQPQVFIDPNTLSKDGSVSVELDGPSNDKKYMAYHINRNGSDWSTSYFIEIATHKQLPDSINWRRGGGVGWAKDGFYYDVYPTPTKGTELTAIAKNDKIYFHKLGDNQANDKFIYSDTAHPDMGLAVQTSEDGRFLFIYKFPGSLGFEVLGKRINSNDDFTVLFQGYDYQNGIIGNKGDTLFVNTNEGADNFKIIATDFNNPAKENWKEIIQERKEKLDHASMVGDHIITDYLVNATSKVYQYNTAGRLEFEAALPGLGTASGFGGFADDKYVLYDYTSFTSPPSVYTYTVATGRSEIFKRSNYPLDLNNYETEQIFYTSKDGTKVPMFLVHKKGIVKDSAHPTLLYAYGGFDISTTPFFWSSMFELLQNNGILAVANIRGGGEYGEAWHKAGMLDKKQNVFDDFIAAADYLVSEKYTSRQKLAIMGGSNGGLLIGAVITQQPAICKVAFPEVGVMDMLRFQKFTSGVFWTTEYGSSDSASQFPTLYKYSPLHNIKTGVNYPATLIMTADHDDRVVPMHSFKFAATMQEKQSGSNPVLIRITTNQGHGASGSSLKKNIESTTDVFSFMFYNMGITPKQ
ncbi:MAG TPA: prolyl oligopeptidase family serine peptidase [Parafilimonas sp.]|nr:prolyl oligopeptidase family serine peptidase [Parafilimonas sp.]